MVTRTRSPVETEPAHGGRWTSLWLAEREWLWRRSEPARAHVTPGIAFVDAGGLEECVPTVRGTPDHGYAWSRAWRRHGSEDVVDCPDFVLRRALSADADAVQARYVLEGEPGYRFIWAAHALLDLGVGARIGLPAGQPTRLYPEAAPLIDREWPRGAPYVTGCWPDPFRLALDEFGPDDGTAVGATVLDVATVDVVDGSARLRMRLDTESDVPVSVSIWRNLGGFPVGRAYRSVGVEPMLGRVFDLADAGPDDVARIPSSGRVEWTLHLEGSS
jgi:hypothetical protein